MLQMLMPHGLPSLIHFIPVYRPMFHRNIRATSLPKSSVLQSRIGPGDFVDCYTSASTLPPRKAAKIATRFPIWVYALLMLRQVFVLPFRLKGSIAAEQTFGIFPLDHETPDELVLGFDDRHLDFRISILSDGSNIHAATWVHTNSRFGKFYLWLIKPFHIFIMKNAVARIARHSLA